MTISFKNFLWPLVLTSLFFVGCGQEKSATSTQPQQQAALTVNLMSMQTSSWPRVVQVNGRIEAWQYSVVGNELSGVPLKEIYAEVGDSVKKGQLLAVFDQETIQAELLQAEADLLDAEASYLLAKQQAERNDRLKGTGALSEDALAKTQFAAISAEAKYKAAKARLQLQKHRVSKVEVRSPDDGVIANRTAIVGTVMSSGAELFSMIRQNRLEWRANVNSQQLSGLTPGLTVTVNISEGLQLTGKVRKIAPLLHTDTLTTSVYVDLPEATGVKAGMFAAGSIQLGSSPAQHLPESALVYRDGFQYLVQVNEQSRVHLIKVETGRRHQDQVEITSVLPTGSRWVVSGGSFLVEGDLVAVKQIEMAAAVVSPNLPLARIDERGN